MQEIHISDARTFLSCRRAWDFSSTLRMGYEPDPIPLHFLVGRLVHFALYAYYEEGVHPVFAYQKMLETHIAEHEPELVYPNPSSKRQQGINTGRQMVANYYNWIESLDAPDEDWETVSNEMSFHLPLFNPEGHASRRIELAGRFDKLARWKGDSSIRKQGIWLWEYKTTAREPDPQWLLLDNQVTTYCHAAQQIIGEPVEGIHFRFLKKKAPEMPRRIRGGTQLSKAINSGTQGVNTTYELYVAAIEELADEQLREKFGAAEVPEVARQRKINALKVEYDDVLTTLAGRGWDEYIKCHDIVKTQAEITNATKDLWLLGLEMCRPTVKIYPAPEWQKCRFCSYREPCLMMNAGEDPSKLLRLTYNKRDRNEPDLDEILSGGEE